MSQYKILFFGGQTEAITLNEKVINFITTIKLILAQGDVMLINTEGKQISQMINMAVCMHALENNICESSLMTNYAYIIPEYIRLMKSEAPMELVRKRIDLMLKTEKPDLAICISGRGHPYQDILKGCNLQNVPVLGVPHYGGFGLTIYGKNDANLGSSKTFTAEVKKHKKAFKDAHTSLRTDPLALVELIRMFRETKG